MLSLLANAGALARTKDNMHRTSAKSGSDVQPVRAGPRRELFHRNPRARRAVQKPLEVEACEMILRLLANMRCEGRDGAGIAGLQLGKCIEVIRRGGSFVL